MPTPLLGYAVYHFSGAQEIFEKAKEAKQRYLGAKTTVEEGREAAREKVGATTAAAKDAVEVKAASIRARWNARRAQGKPNEDE